MHRVLAAEIRPGTVVHTYLGDRTVNKVDIPKNSNMVRLDYTFGPQEYYLPDESVDVKPLAS